MLLVPDLEGVDPLHILWVEVFSGGRNDGDQKVFVLDGAFVGFGLIWVSLYSETLDLTHETSGDVVNTAASLYSGPQPLLLMKISIFRTTNLYGLVV